MGGFPGENLDVQAGTAILLHGDIDPVDILRHKLLGDDAALGVLSGLFQHRTDVIHVLAELVFRQLLLLQVLELILGCTALLLTLPVHGEEVTVGNLTSDVVLQQLALFFLNQIDAAAACLDFFVQPAPSV